MSSFIVEDTRAASSEWVSIPSGYYGFSLAVIMHAYSPGWADTVLIAWRINTVDCWDLKSFQSIKHSVFSSSI